jgi:hypothetical protein
MYGRIDVWKRTNYEIPHKVLDDNISAVVSILPALYSSIPQIFKSVI